MSDSTRQDIDWLRHLVASSSQLSSGDLKQINRMVVEGDGRLPSAKQLPESLRDKLFPRRTTDHYKPIQWKRRIT